MRNLRLALALALIGAASPALAQDQTQVPTQVPAQVPVQAPGQAPTPPAQDGAQPNVPSRYTFNRVDDGFLRLDNNSGQIMFCSSHGVGWACRVVPEDRAALEKEIARLQDEVASLKQAVAALRAPPRPPAELAKLDLAPPTAGKSEDAVKLREDIEQARVAIENAWRRLVDMIVAFQKDMMRKG